MHANSRMNLVIYEKEQKKNYIIYFYITLNIVYAIESEKHFWIPNK